MDRDHAAISRRRFVRQVLAAGTSVAVAPAIVGAQRAVKKIRLGVIGCGGRGSWIAKLFAQHGGFEIHAVADYFQHVADACGDSLGVDKSRRFAGLSGYQKVIASGVEAVATEAPPYFLPEHVTAAVEAGLHVYSAKPVAADVPGAMRVLAAGKKATEKQQCLLVDYQMPTDPINIEVVQRIHDGGLGRIAHASSFGYCTGFPDPPRSVTIENRLQNLIWVNDIAMGCDYIGNFDIHAIDAALWAIGKTPIAAAGHSRILRRDPHGDARDACQVLYEFDDGLTLSHHGQGLPNQPDEGLTVKLYGTLASALLNYWNRSYLRGGPKHYAGGNVESLYLFGAERNIATFHQSITSGNFENSTLQRAIDGVLTCILGREAGIRHTRLTMEQLIKENQRLTVDLTGLKA